MRTFYISINLTNRCNLNCSYCIADIPYTYIHNDISYNQIRYIIKMINTYLADFKIRLYLVGGEPLVYPQLNSIIQNLHEIKNMERLSICTNGTFYIKNLISDYFPIYYMLTYHADVIADKQLFLQHTNFIKNLEYITNQSNLKYHIKIMNNSNKINKLKDKFLNEIKGLLVNNKDIEYPVFLSTKYYLILFI